MNTPPFRSKSFKTACVYMQCIRKDVHTIVMIRHGESTWNLDKRFTGWCDIPLTSRGEVDAKDAGALMGERGLKFDIAFTSNLERAWRTCALALSGKTFQFNLKRQYLLLTNSTYYKLLDNQA